jgi:hypothetical protein
MNDQLGSVFAGGLVLIVLFMLLRRAVLWYWRINEAVNLLRSIDRRLELIAGSHEPQAEYGSAPEPEGVTSVNE